MPKKLVFNLLLRLEAVVIDDDQPQMMSDRTWTELNWGAFAVHEDNKERVLANLKKLTQVTLMDVAEAGEMMDLEIKEFNEQEAQCQDTPSKSPCSN